MQKRNHSPSERPEDNPEAEAIARSIRRLTGFSLSILFLGVFAVLGAILYKSLNPQQEDLPQTAGEKSGLAAVNGPLWPVLPPVSRFDLPSGFALHSLQWTGQQWLIILQKDQRLVMVTLSDEQLQENGPQALIRMVETEEGLRVN
jgi:hypothetical protein